MFRRSRLRHRLVRLGRAVVPAHRRPRRFVIETLESRMLLSFSPTGLEQEMLEFMNRMRMTPAAELGLMTDNVATTPAHSTNPEINAALSFFNVSGPTLASQWSELVAAPPLAWNSALYDAATGHNQQMIQGDAQSHQLPGEPDLVTRTENAGYNDFQALGENIFAFGQSTFGSHAAFAIDWGNTPTGIQTPPGHRNNMMSANFREIGVAITPENNAGTSVGPLVITEDFGNRFDIGNPFLLGVVYRDTDGDSQYDAGEGLSGVTVTVAGTTSVNTTTMTAGGWQLQALAGTYTVTFSGGTLSGPATVSNVTVGSANVKVDHRASPASTPTFTDDPLATGSTPVSIVHVQELRSAINTLRTSRGLAAFTFDDAVLVSGVTPVRAAHIQQLRTAVNEVFTHLGATPPTYTDPTIVAGQTVVKAAHIQELRIAARGPQSPSSVTVAALNVEAVVAIPVTPDLADVPDVPAEAHAETSALPETSLAGPAPGTTSRLPEMDDRSESPGNVVGVATMDAAVNGTALPEDVPREADRSEDVVRVLDLPGPEMLPDPIVPVLVRRY